MHQLIPLPAFCISVLSGIILPAGQFQPVVKHFNFYTSILV